jgi:hypothetical protein
LVAIGDLQESSGHDVVPVQLLDGYNHFDAVGGVNGGTIGNDNTTPSVKMLE